MENKKINGWLFLPFFHLGIMAYVLIPSVFIALLFSEKINTPQSLAYLLFIILGLFSIFSLLLGFDKRKIFLKYSIFTLWFSVVCLMINLFLNTTLYDFPFKERQFYVIFVAIVWVIIWTLYLKKSKKVRNIFIK